MNTSTLPRPDYRTSLEASDAINSDIIKVLERNFQHGVSQTKEFAQQFRGDTRKETAENVWNFLKEHITYVRDSKANQNIKLPARFINDQVGDCRTKS